jgi:hypothetical protein
MAPVSGAIFFASAFFKARHNEARQNEASARTGRCALAYRIQECALDRNALKAKSAKTGTLGSDGEEANETFCFSCRTDSDRLVRERHCGFRRMSNLFTTPARNRDSLQLERPHAGRHAGARRIRALGQCREAVQQRQGLRRWRCSGPRSRKAIRVCEWPRPDMIGKHPPPDLTHRLHRGIDFLRRAERLSRCTFS